MLNYVIIILFYVVITDLELTLINCKRKSHNVKFDLLSFNPLQYFLTYKEFHLRDIKYNYVLNFHVLFYYLLEYKYTAVSKLFKQI